MAGQKASIPKARVIDEREAELDDGRMPFLNHLMELRLRLRNAVLCFIVAAVGAWFFSEDIYAWLRGPLDQAWAHHTEALGPNTVMHYGSVVEPFWVYMSVAMWTGIFVSSPLIFYQLWKFIAPGLYKNERRKGVFFAAASAIFFVGGAAFCYYFVLENLFDFLLGYSDKNTQPTLFLTEYLDLTRDMMLAFGAVFELPVLIYFLAAIGLVTPRSLWRFNRWFIVLAFIIGAVLTPSPDALSQIAMATPMIVLYNFSIVVAWWVVRSKRKADLDAGIAP